MQPDERFLLPATTEAKMTTDDGDRSVTFHSARMKRQVGNKLRRADADARNDMQIYDRNNTL